MDLVNSCHLNCHSASENKVFVAGLEVPVNSFGLNKILGIILYFLWLKENYWGPLSSTRPTNKGVDLLIDQDPAQSVVRVTDLSRFKASQSPHYYSRVDRSYRDRNGIIPRETLGSLT